MFVENPELPKSVNIALSYFCVLGCFSVLVNWVTDLSSDVLLFHLY